MSPEKRGSIAEKSEEKLKIADAQVEERRKYEKDLSDLMDQQMQHIAALIAKKRKLEDQKTKNTLEVNDAFQEVAHQREKLAQKKRELEMEEQLVGERKRGL